jgi:LacI family transcriptional regulator
MLQDRVRPMSTINDVAAMAGVSAMTVSRVVNNSGYTSKPTRARVERAIAELGYVPNALARQLRSRNTKTLALVLSDISNPFFTTIARGVEDTASAHGFAVMFCNTDESEEEEARYLRLLIERQIDGVLLVPAGNSRRSLATLRGKNTPAVVIDRRVSSRRVDTVRSDSEAGAYGLTRHLVQLGHHRIAVLSGRRTVSTSVDRVAGCRRALEEVGLELDPRLTVYGDFNFGDRNQADGHRMAEQVLAVSPRPTAIFAANNFIASGAIRAIREAGLLVPDDISVVAFDDPPAEWVLEPFLTVTGQPAYEIGQRAAELLLARLSGERTVDGEDVVLPTDLIVRRSSGPPPPTRPGPSVTRRLALDPVAGASS